MLNKNYKSAIDYFNKYETFIPNDTNSKFLKGYCYEKLNLPKRALTQYDLALEEFDQNLNAMVNKAGILYKQNKKDEVKKLI